MTIVLVEQDAELDQLCQAIEQLREEKVKESGRADKLVKELNGEYFLVGVIAGVISWLNGFLRCPQIIVGG